MCVLCVWWAGLVARRLAVCAAARHPLPVGLHLHRAPAQPVRVQQQVARLRLDVLPAVASGGHWKHNGAFQREIAARSTRNTRTTSSFLGGASVPIVPYVV